HLIFRFGARREHLDPIARERRQVAGGHLRAPGVVHADEEHGGLRAHEQQLPPGVMSVLHTPVAGSTSSTRAAASTSPASQATIERTCSYPVASRKVGARP